jgi:hypothetical protein
MNYEEIWPEAYDTSQPVRLCGKIRAKKMISAWLSCRDGRVYNLTKDEFLALGCEIPVHSKYRKPR